jgi:DNA-binding transcriptional LysR family regulator
MGLGGNGMDMNWLQDFVCLGRELNFTRAAEERNITQPAFSRRIKSLETWLGTPLVKRSTYPVQLSDAGLQFLPLAREVVTTLTDIRQSIRAAERGTTAFQRFAVLHTISVHYLSGRIAELENDIPGLRVRVYSDNLRTCCQFLQEGNCDFLLYYRHKDVMPVFDERQFERKDIGVEQFIPVAETQAARAGGWDLSAQNGGDIPYLSYDPASFLGSVVDQTIGARKPRLALCYMDALAEALKRRALAGSGVAWLPERAILDELARGLLVPVGGAEWQTTLTLSLFCSVDRLDRVGKQVWAAL